MANIQLSSESPKAYIDYAESVMVSKTYYYEGNPVSFSNNGKVMVSATQMSKPFGKLVGDWLRLKSTDEFVTALSSDMQIPISQLVVVNKGNSSAFEQGTWLHEDVALEFARWLSPKFAIWCNRRIKELMKVGFTATPETLESMIANPDLVIGMATQLKHLRAENEEKQRKIEADAPKVLFAEAVETSDSVCLVGELAKILKQNGIKNMGQNRLYKWLRSHCYLGNKGDNYNLPTQKAMDLGVFKVIKGKRIDQHTGGVIVTRTAKVTTKGLSYFINKFMNTAAVL